ncbi:MAG: hypothetical protein R2932_50480 [Caldilineaceae bacterium]
MAIMRFVSQSGAFTIITENDWVFTLSADERWVIDSLHAIHGVYHKPIENCSKEWSLILTENFYDLERKDLFFPSHKNGTSLFPFWGENDVPTAVRRFDCIVVDNIYFGPDLVVRSFD